MKTFSVIGCIVCAVIGIVLGIIGNIYLGTSAGKILMFWGAVSMIWAAAYWVVYLVYRKVESQPKEE